MKTDTLYIIPTFQGKVADICWGSCGKAIIGAVVDEELGECLLCKAAKCNDEKGRLDLGCAEIGGEKYEHVIVRKLVVANMEGKQ